MIFPNGMAARHPLALALVGLAFLGSACGAETLRRPVDLPITTYPANELFTLTLVMQRCRQPCETYSDPECEVTVNEDSRTIRVDPEVEVERDDDATCSGQCSGAPVLAHCSVGPLNAGEWIVESTQGRFSRAITVR